MNPDDFWTPWEEPVSSFDQALNFIHGIFDDWTGQQRLFAWRGQVDATWPLHSSLYRRLLWTKGTTLEEPELQDEEAKLLADAHRWGLHMGPYGRLSILDQLASLQHYGAPTRLIDITFNPLIGLWFAVEARWDNGHQKPDEEDGRLFAIDVTHRLINEDDQHRHWEDALRRPWPRVTAGNPAPEWTTHVHAWRPARFDQRIAAQNGGFLLGGVPTTQNGNNWRTAPQDQTHWSIEDVRQSTSIALRPHLLIRNAGRPPQDPVYTLRIKHSAKQEIRERLQRLYGYQASTLYPDYTGFAQFACSHLKTRPT